MSFQYYNPKKLIPLFREYGVSDKVCQGCVASGVSPEFCTHPFSDMNEPESGVQSDILCPHCRDTADEFGSIKLWKDSHLAEKVAKLEEILRQL